MGGYLNVTFQVNVNIADEIVTVADADPNLSGVEGVGVFELADKGLESHREINLHRIQPCANFLIIWVPSKSVSLILTEKGEPVKARPFTSLNYTSSQFKGTTRR